MSWLHSKSLKYLTVLNLILAIGVMAFLMLTLSGCDAGSNDRYYNNRGSNGRYIGQGRYGFGPRNLDEARSNLDAGSRGNAGSGGPSSQPRAGNPSVNGGGGAGARGTFGLGGGGFSGEAEDEINGIPCNYCPAYVLDGFEGYLDGGANRPRGNGIFAGSGNAGHTGVITFSGQSRGNGLFSSLGTSSARFNVGAIAGPRVTAGGYRIRRDGSTDDPSYDAEKAAQYRLAQRQLGSGLSGILAGNPAAAHNGFTAGIDSTPDTHRGHVHDDVDAYYASLLDAYNDNNGDLVELRDLVRNSEDKTLQSFHKSRHGIPATREPDWSVLWDDWIAVNRQVDGAIKQGLFAAAHIPLHMLRDLSATLVATIEDLGMIAYGWSSADAYYNAVGPEYNGYPCCQLIEDEFSQ